jgi:hypothetical protein
MKYIISGLFAVAAFVANAQTGHLIDSVLANNIIRIPFYQLAKVGNETLVLQMNYASSSFVDTTGVYKLRNAQILSVDLLFTDYPANQNLIALNKRRLQALADLVPVATQQPTTLWQIIRQLDGKDKASAANMLHGFVINYRGPETDISKKKEIDLIKSVTPTLIKIPAEVPPVEDKVSNWSAIQNGGLNQQRIVIYNRPLRKSDVNKPVLQKMAVPKDTIVSFTYKEAKSNQLIPDMRTKFLRDKDSVFFLLAPQLQAITKLVPPTLRSLGDSSVLKTLKRNQFSKMLVIADVTNSMSPYVAQIFAWINSEAEKSNVQYVVCFNDGDGRDNDYKKIGRTGGVYGEVYKDAIQLSNLIISTMDKCQNNDIQENDCEAIIKGIDLCSDCEDVVLLADSWAPVRDISLAVTIKKPIKVIACGNRIGIRPEYIEIALKTNGSLHFMDEDIVDLSPLRKGKQMMIHGKLYTYKNGWVNEVVR